MAKIRWTTKAWISFESNRIYLTDKWGANAAKKFVRSVDKRLEILAHFPSSGYKIDAELDIRRITINRRVVLIYQYDQDRNEIDLDFFWNTYQLPDSEYKY